MSDKRDILSYFTQTEQTESYDAQIGIAILYLNFDLLSQALQTAKSVPDNHNKFEVLSKIAEAYAKNEEFSTALEIAQSIENTYTRTQTFEDIVKQVKNTQVLTEVLKEAQNLKNTDSVPSLLAKIAISYAKFGDYDQAWEIVENISNDSKKTEAINRIIDNVKNVEELKQVLARVASIPRDVNEFELLTKTAVSYAKFGDFNEALKVAKNVRNESYAAHISLEIASSYAKHGEFDQALKIAKNIQDESLKSNALTEIIKYLTDDNIFIEILEIIKPMKQGEDKFKILNEITKSTNNHLVLLKILDSTKAIIDENLKSLALTGIVEHTKNTQIYTEVLQMGEKINDIRSRSNIISKVAIGYARDNQYSLALEKVDCLGVEVIKSQTLAEIAKNTTDTKILTEILKRSQRLESTPTQNIAMFGVVEGYVKNKKLPEAKQVTQNIAGGYRKSKALDLIVESYAKLFVESLEENKSTNILAWFSMYIEPLLTIKTTHEGKLDLINKFLSFIPVPCLKNQTQELQITIPNNHKAKEDEKVDLRHVIKKASNDNLYLFSVNLLMKEIKEILKLPNSTTDLDGFRSNLTNKIVSGDISVSSRLLLTLLKKNTEDSFRYLQKYIFTLKDRDLPPDIRNNYLKLFVRVAVNYSMLSNCWLKVIPKKIESVLKIVAIWNKKKSWDLMSLNSLFYSLDKLDCLIDDIENTDLIITVLDNSIISPTLYKILKLCPKDKIQSVISQINIEQSRIFTSQTPTLKEIKQILTLSGVQNNLDEISEEDLLLEIIVSVFKIKDYQEAKALLKELIQNEDVISQHLSQYLKKGQPSENININSELQILSVGQAIDYKILNNLKNGFGINAKLGQNNQQNKLNLSSFISGSDFKLESLPNILEFLSKNQNLEFKISSIESALNELKKLNKEILEFHNEPNTSKNAGSLEKLNFKYQNIYFQVLNQIDELNGILLKDNIGDVLSKNSLNNSPQNEEFALNKIQKLFKNCFNTKLEKRKFINYIDPESKTRQIQAYISKNPVSFFAKAGAYICTADDIKTWLDFENHFHINFIENGKLAANIQAYVENVNGEEVLILRGLNPTVDFLDTISGDLFVKTVFDYAIELSKIWFGKEQIYLTENLSNWHADSNRPQIRDSLMRLVYNNTDPISHTMNITHNMKVDKIYPIDMNKLLSQIINKI